MKTILCSIFISILSLSAFAQKNYYVSKNGKNRGHEGTINEPFKTIQYGCNALEAGDTLNILGGTYYEKFELNVSGKSNKLITIRPYKNDSVFIDGSENHTKKALFYAHDKSFFSVQQLHFQNNFHLNGDGGFYVDGYGDTIQLLNCTFTNISISKDTFYTVSDSTNQPTISFIGDDENTPLSNITIKNIEIANCRPGFSECLTINGNATNFEISNNNVHNNGNIGIDIIGNYGVCANPELDHARNGIIKNNNCNNNISPVSAAAGIYIDGGHNIIIENNILYGNDYGAEIGCEEFGTANNITFKNNVIFNNTKAGIALGGYDETTGGRVTNTKVVNNTFYNNDTENNGNGEIYFTQFENGEVSNNIFYISNQNFLMSCYREQPNLLMDYNLLYCNNGSKAINAFCNNTDIVGLKKIIRLTGIGKNNSFGNPNFVSAKNNNFKLRANSAAINAGNPEYTIKNQALDFNANSRVYNTVIDCGAFEFNDSPKK